MPSIVIVDDREDARTTHLELIRPHVPEGWQVIDVAPLLKIEEYPLWLLEQDCGCLVLDERLTEVPGGATYSGHDVIDHVRERLPEYPIFVLTSYPKDEELVRRFGAVEALLARNEFQRRPREHTARIVRSAQRFLDAHEQRLSELGEVSARIASGGELLGDRTRARAISELLGLAFAAAAQPGRRDLIDGLGSTLDQWDELRDQLDSLLPAEGDESE